MRIVLTLCFLIVAEAAWGQDQQIGARTKAMGGSYTAFEDDPVSVWLNPAGIATQPDQGVISYQSYTVYERGRERAPGNQLVFTVKPKSAPADPPYWPSYLGVVFQVGDAEAPMAIGICFARPYLLKYSMDLVTNPSQTAFEPEAQVEETLSRFRVGFAKDFRLRPAGEPGFFNHVSVGLGVDIGFAQWRFSDASSDEATIESAVGGGAGVLIGVYDDTESFKVNVGVAYQSAVKFSFAIETDILPAFDVPQQLNVGLAMYLLTGTPLRLTFDLQWIDWSATAEDPIFAGFRKFKDALNFSMGAEYRIKVSERVNLYPRAGYRRFDPPWEDKDDLPMTGSYRLVLDTKGSKFNLVTAGLGVRWTTAEQKIRSVDLAVDTGGDATNFAIEFNYEF